MHFAYPIISLLLSSFTFTVAEDPWVDNSPPAPQIISESNGVTTNWGPVSSGDASSCWNPPDALYDPTKPIKNGGTCRVCVVQNATGQEPDIDPYYEMWVRDDKNHAIGDQQPFTLEPWSTSPSDVSIPDNTIGFTAGGSPLNVWTHLPAEDDKNAVVYMVWNRPAGWIGPETMIFDTGSNEKVAANNCTLNSINQRDDASIYFSCQFNCGTIKPKKGH